GDGQRLRRARAGHAAADAGGARAARLAPEAPRRALKRCPDRVPANPSGGSFDPSRAVHPVMAVRADPPDVGPLRVRSHAIDPRDPTLIRPSLTTLRAALCGIG